MPASNTVGEVAETKTILQSVTYVRTDLRTDKGKTVCPSPLRGEGIDKTSKSRKEKSQKLTQAHYKPIICIERIINVVNVVRDTRFGVRQT